MNLKQFIQLPVAALQNTWENAVGAKTDYPFPGAGFDIIKNMEDVPLIPLSVLLDSDEAIDQCLSEAW